VSVKRFITYFLYRNYRFSAAVKHRVRRKFTPVGGLAIAAMILTGGVGVDTSQAIAYQAFVLLWLLLVVALIWSFFPAPYLRAERTLPRVGTAGQPLHYALTVTNPHERVQQSVTVTEDMGDPRPTYAEFANTPEPGERRRNLFDRFFRFYRWMWLTALKQMAIALPAKIPPLQPMRKTEVPMQLIPQRRGQLRLGGLIFTVTDPFGFCRRFSRDEAPQKVLILPKRYHVPNVSFGGPTQYQPGGVSMASSLGESEEFMSVREYRRGDPLRHIHWKSTSKTGKLIVKEFQNEFFVRHALVLDTFLEQSNNPVFEEAVSIAASFAMTLNTQDSLLDLLFVGPEAFTVSTGHGVAQVDHMLEILAAVQPCTARGFVTLEDMVLRQVALVSACVSIFLTWDEDRRDLVEQIAVLAIPQIVIILKKPGQTDPEIKLRNDRFVRVLIVDSSKVQESLNKL
jgi:uncharacterized protein (DUF58 family)